MSGEILILSRAASLADAAQMQVLLAALPEQLRKPHELEHDAFGSAYASDTETLYLVCSTGEHVASHAISPLSVTEANGVYQRIAVVPLDLRQHAVKAAVDAAIGVTWMTRQ